jgi:hypothetical protein
MLYLKYHTVILPAVLKSRKIIKVEWAKIYHKADNATHTQSCWTTPKPNVLHCNHDLPTRESVRCNGKHSTSLVDDLGSSRHFVTSDWVHDRFCVMNKSVRMHNHAGNPQTWPAFWILASLPV